MKEIRILALAAMSLGPILPAAGQDHQGFENECDSFRNATPADLLSFLHATTPDEKNGDCITWAIKRLGREQYEPSISALIRLLDFRRPRTQREKQGIYLRMQGLWEIYPAVGALDLMGKKALPELLRAIEADSTSVTARENAVSVWMEIYRYGDEHPKGVALLKQEEMNAKNDATMQRLAWAVHKALKWCNPPEEVACTAAASNPVSPK